MSGNGISREKWVGLFELGFQLGQRERNLSPENRRDRVEPRLNYDDEPDGAELEALQAGYEAGKEKAFPGANIDVEQEANSAYDNSGYAAGLEEWT